MIETRIDVETCEAACHATAGLPSQFISAVPTMTVPRLYRRFIVAALALTLSLGTTWGAVNLAWIMYAIGPVPPSHVQVHGQVQVFGFMYLFIVGIAYYVIPRFSGRPLRFPLLAEASFFLLVLGVLARSLGQPFGYTAAGRFLLLASAGSSVAGILFFALTVVGTAAGGRTASLPTGTQQRIPRASQMEPYILAGIFWMIGSTVFSAVTAFHMERFGLTALSGVWQRPLWFAALYGGALSWIFGVATRVLPGFMATRPARAGLVRAGFVLLQAGVVSMMLSSITGLSEQRDLSRISRIFAYFGVAASILTTVTALHGLRAAPGRTHPGPAVFRRFLMSGFFWAVVTAFLLLVSGVIEIVYRREPHSLLQDAVRHAFTLGTLVMILFGMASRIIPVFEGVPLARPGLAVAGLHLMNAGILLRMTQIGAAFVWPGFMPVAGASGFFALAGTIAMSVVILATIHRGRRTSM
jgi:hypothetical protein